MLDATNTPAFYTVPEAARILRLSRNTLYRAIRGGDFEHVRVGETIRIPARVLAELAGEPQC